MTELFNVLNKQVCVPLVLGISSFLNTGMPRYLKDTLFSLIPFEFCPFYARCILLINDGPSARGLFGFGEVSATHISCHLSTAASTLYVFLSNINYASPWKYDRRWRTYRQITIKRLKIILNGYQLKALSHSQAVQNYKTFLNIM